MFGIEKHIIDMILSEISKHKVIHDILIFGSRAKGNFQKGSDIDKCMGFKKIINPAGKQQSFCYSLL